ncbi:MAG TPA: hypothetical protein PKC23_02470, partial [Candidatus Desulfobacillus sp.]|nr:hypothetical protein [Candidatus Desulfobacillus sp.]
TGSIDYLTTNLHNLTHTTRNSKSLRPLRLCVLCVEGGASKAVSHAPVAPQGDLPGAAVFSGKRY